MARIITIPNDNDSVMNSERERIVPWAPSHGWIYTGYDNESDHIAQIRRVGAGQPLAILDFDCHGNPAVFDDTNINTALQFGRTLAQSPGFSAADTAVYLDACNTGLTSSFGGPIAQTVADGAGCAVYGTKGYMNGTYAEEDEHCYAKGSDGKLPAYPGAQDAIGRDVWIAFHARTREAREETRKTDMIQATSINIRAGTGEAEGLSAMLQRVMRSEPVEFPQLRMAPDITINYSDERSVTILDVYANGGLVRDRIGGKTWRVEDPAEFHVAIREALR
jgi:hypothetical protein